MSRTLEGMVKNAYERHRGKLSVRASVVATARELERPVEEVETLLGFQPKVDLKPANYKALEQWHHTCGSNEYYITWLQGRAAKENAPLDVIYINVGKWVTVRDLPADHPFRRSWEKQ